MKVNYKVYNPAGNITALVIGDNYTLEERRKINDEIMRKDSTVEQVGFVSTKEKRLTMAGGEFCGNATRSAILYYRMQESESIKINNQTIKGGIKGKNLVWCELPVNNYKLNVIDKDIYEVVLEGITIIIIGEKLSQDYLAKDIKVEAKKIISTYNIYNNDAIGVMFLEKNKNLKINPVVWVKSIDTLFFENACGSGTIATSILKTVLESEGNRYMIEQPSGEILETNIEIQNGIVTKAILSGNIYEEEIKELII